MKKNSFWVLILFILACGNGQVNISNLNNQNIIIFTLDGMRWQEIFKGIDSSLVHSKNFTRDEARWMREYWSDTVAVRRARLFPFLWSTIHSQGMLLGNRMYGNKIDTKNPYWFSYPGYNELFTGFPDTLVNSNEKIYNKNISVLEYLHRQPAFHDKVSVFATWDVFPYIFNQPRSQLYINADQSMPSSNDVYQLINDLQRLTTRPLGVRPDLLTYIGAREYLKRNKPRVMYIAFDETDDFAHAGMYDEYIESAHAQDGMIADLWSTVQSMPEYKDKTTLLITCDHGRGDHIKSQWQDHGNKIDDAHEIWLALMGPSIDPLGELKDSMQLYQGQIAATIADLIGEKFTADHPVLDKMDIHALKANSSTK